jgi:hypothetical protein
MPDKPFLFIGRGKEDIRIRVVDDEVNHTHLVIDIQLAANPKDSLKVIIRTNR